MIDLAVDALAAWRLTRLARTDTITEPARDWITERSVEVRASAADPRTLADDWSTLVNVQPFAFARDLLDCPWCTSVWMAALTLVLPRRLRRLLAIAALAGFAASMIDDREEKR